RLRELLCVLVGRRERAFEHRLHPRLRRGEHRHAPPFLFLHGGVLQDDAGQDLGTKLRREVLDLLAPQVHGAQLELHEHLLAHLGRHLVLVEDLVELLDLLREFPLRLLFPGAATGEQTVSEAGETADHGPDAGTDAGHERAHAGAGPGPDERVADRVVPGARAGADRRLEHAAGELTGERVADAPREPAHATDPTEQPPEPTGPTTGTRCTRGTGSAAPTGSPSPTGGAASSEPPGERVHPTAAAGRTGCCPDAPSAERQWVHGPRATGCR